jgi:fatty-acyl-CoA synthase
MKPIVKGFPATTQDDYQLNVTNILRQAAGSFGSQEIVSRRHDGSMLRYTYKEAYGRIQRLANALEGLGINAGDRIGVLAWNTYENYEIYFGVPGMGAVMLLLNLRLAPQDLSYVINHSGASLIIVDETLLRLVEAVAPGCPKVKGYVILTPKKISEVQTKLSTKRPPFTTGRTWTSVQPMGPAIPPEPRACPKESTTPIGTCTCTAVP